MPGRGTEESEQMKQLMEQMREKEYQGLTEDEIREKERQKECRKKHNIRALDNTLDILTQGYYIRDGVKISLKLSPARMRTVRVFLPDEINTLAEKNADVNAATEVDDVPCICSCENTDALSLAWKRYQSLRRDGKVLVRNRASPSRPGGGGRRGADAQAEELCRRSSLLLSLESEQAKTYYAYHQSRNTRMGSDAVMITPDVEVIKDHAGELLAETFPISVMTCAAPMVRLGFEGMSQREYVDMLHGRITGMLRCAAFLGYQHLVLGAFGCGAFGNDAAVVSDVFHRAIYDFAFAKGKGCDMFAHIDFAVLCSPGREYNFREFCRNFSHEIGRGS